ncbi:hypothetical protein, conserved [Leishmania tarentolae]|uniref:Uncharacterized protein n=1 Tax=Leishmania tarentolae TaxID=5689 RepID=A0A640K7U2_LEITA|nr:hypothetical protein, conserved [Leishmania tarentolae]
MWEDAHVFTSPATSRNTDNGALPEPLAGCVSAQRVPAMPSTPPPPLLSSHSFCVYAFQRHAHTMLASAYATSGSVCTATVISTELPSHQSLCPPGVAVTAYHHNCAADRYRGGKRAPCSHIDGFGHRPLRACDVCGRRRQRLPSKSLFFFLFHVIRTVTRRRSRTHRVGPAARKDEGTEGKRSGTRGWGGGDCVRTRSRPLPSPDTSAAAWHAPRHRYISMHTCSSIVARSVRTLGGVRCGTAAATRGSNSRHRCFPWSSTVCQRGARVGLTLGNSFRGPAIAVNSTSTSGALSMAYRHQASDQFHRFLHHPHVVQPDGVDGLPRVKGDQQQWLNTEQWHGYSDTYLKRHMQYPATVELNNPAINARHDLLYECLGLVYELYGGLAEDLQELHDDPLHPRFHDRIARIKRDRERIADELDKRYAKLHPTVKTVYDAFLVRRYYHLADWIEHVEQKRARLLNTLSPDVMERMMRMRGIAEQYLRHLRVLEHALYEDPLMGLLESGGDTNALEQYTPGELAILRQKAAYFRKMRRFGANQLDADVHTH